MTPAEKQKEKIYDDIVYFRKDGELYYIQRDGSIYHECEECESATYSRFYLVAESVQEFEALSSSED